MSNTSLCSQSCCPSCGAPCQCWQDHSGQHQCINCGTRWWNDDGESVELGDGEPSPPLPNCPECKQVMVPVDSIVDGRNVTGYACHKCASVYSPESSHRDAQKLERIRQAAVKISWRDGAYRVNKPNFDGGWVVPLEIAIKEISGAAQEVSPPSPETAHIWDSITRVAEGRNDDTCLLSRRACQKLLGEKLVGGDTRELKAALKEGILLVILLRTFADCREELDKDAAVRMGKFLRGAERLLGEPT